MDNNYQIIKKAARKSQWLLSVRVIYFLVFTVLFIGILGFFIPQTVYRYSGKNPALEGKMILKNLPMPYLANDERELYRFYWFAVTKGNLRYYPVDEKISLRWMGKKEETPLVSQIGNQLVVNYLFESNYFLTQPVQTEVFSGGITPQFLPSKIQNVSGAYEYPIVSNEELLAFLASKGKYYNADISASFKQKKNYSEAKQLANKQINILHYNIETPHSTMSAPQLSQFGFSEDLLYGSFSDNDVEKWVEKNVKEALTFLSDKKSVFDFSKDLPGDPFAENSNSMTSQNYDFKDILDYVEYNGVKIESIRVTGQADELVQWFKEHQEDFRNIQIHQVKEWDYQNTFYVNGG